MLLMSIPGWEKAVGYELPTLGGGGGFVYAKWTRTRGRFDCIWVTPEV
jgi:hypothetical protein